MNDRWFYSHDGSKLGPCSGRQLRELASWGGILQTDTVWKEGIARGVLAIKVKNLFTPAQLCQTSSAPVVEPPLPLPTAAPDDISTPPEAPAQPFPASIQPMAESAPEASIPAEAPANAAVVTDPVPVEKPSPTPPVSSGNWQQNQTRKGRAVAGRGAVLVGQDGVNVKYRKKCTTCGHTDPSWGTMPIRNGVMRVGFYCIKCRKHRDVEVHGSFH